MERTCDRYTLARCLELIREVREEFRSEEYAANQPVGSFSERFACDQVANRIESEFALGTIEQCNLLGKPTPFEQHKGTDNAK